MIPWYNISHQASESACAYYNGNFDSYPAEYVDFLRSYFIAQIDAFEYGDKVSLARHCQTKSVEQNII